MLCQLLAMRAVIDARGHVTLNALPYLVLPYHIAPKYAYSFAPDIMDYLATKFQYLSLPRLTYRSKTNKNPSSSHVLPAPKNYVISHD